MIRVAINAKGGDCWQVFRQVILSLMERSEYVALDLGEFSMNVRSEPGV
jgi:hypothetical protein